MASMTYFATEGESGRRMRLMIDLRQRILNVEHAEGGRVILRNVGANQLTVARTNEVVTIVNNAGNRQRLVVRFRTIELARGFVRALGAIENRDENLTPGGGDQPPKGQGGGGSRPPLGLKSRGSTQEQTQRSQSLYMGSSNQTEAEKEYPVGGEEYEFKFTALDRLLNVGPCKALRSTIPNNELGPALKESSRDNCFDLVSASGNGKDSSLCFFERTVRPDVLMSLPLENALQFWSVGRRGGYHRYLIVARELNTLVLELDVAMTEMERSLFITSETTVAAGELCAGLIAVQVTPTTIVLAREGDLLETTRVDTNFPIAAASIVDPYIALLTQNGRLLLYRLKVDDTLHLAEVQVPARMKHERTSITSTALYRDVSGIARMCTGEGQRRDRLDPGKDNEVSSVITGAGNDDDDLEMLLYRGEEGTVHTATKRKGEDKVRPEIAGSDAMNPARVVPSYWMFLARENGNLYVYSIPDMQLVYFVKRFNQVPDTLFDDPTAATEDEGFVQPSQFATQPQSIETARAADPVSVKTDEVVMEMQLTGMGFNQARPVLTLLIDDVVSFYEMFSYDSGIDGHLAVRFRRLKCCVVTRGSRFMGQYGRNPVEAARETDRYRSLLCSFEKIDQLSSGIVICGAYPSVMIIERGEPRLHPMTIDGHIISFTAFNNVNCANGFLYLRKDRLMRISQLQSEVTYDAPCPVRKVPFPGCTIHSVVYLLQSKVYALVTSVPSPTNKLCVLISEDKQVETLEREETFVLPAMESHSLRLFTSEDWSYVPGAELKMDEFEVITCCDEVLLSSESTVSGMMSYLAVGTVVNYGEDIYARGKIILCEITEVVPEVDQPTSRHKIKVVYSKEQKGPVTSLCACNGYLLTGMGQKIFIWQFRDGELNGVSFLDMHFYIHGLVGFRSLALSCDLFKSLALIRYQEEFKALSVVSRDLRPTAPSPMTSQFLIDNNHVGFILSDEAGNLTIFNYSPELKESGGGERLIIRASINIGSLVNAFVRVKGHVTEAFIENPAQARETQNCLFATLDGSFGVVRPLPEKVFRRLHMLQQVMSVHIPQTAGLNPRGSRFSRPQTSATSQQISTARNIVDGNLVFQYLYLSNSEKAELAKKATTNRAVLMDDLVELSRLTSWF